MIAETDGFAGLPAWVPTAIFIPEAVDPDHIHGAVPLRTELHRLQIGVLADAVRVIYRGPHDARRLQGLYVETWTWFATDDHVSEWPFTFCNCCQALDLLCTRVRARVLAADFAESTRKMVRRMSGSRTRMVELLHGL